MPTDINLDTILSIVESPTLGAIKIGIIAYIGLLWLFIIIWVTRDAINRSDSLIFQVFAILLNIAIPILGVLLYLIIRPGKTRTERYYEELEHRLIIESLPSKEKKKKKSVKNK